MVNLRFLLIPLTFLLSPTLVSAQKRFFVLQRENPKEVPTGAWHPSHVGMHRVLLETEESNPDVNLKVKGWHVFDLWVRCSRFSFQKKGPHIFGSRLLAGTLLKVFCFRKEVQTCCNPAQISQGDIALSWTNV